MIYEGDCLEIMPTLAEKSVDMILCDLPYGTTACKWDTIIPFEPLWKQYKRLIKDNGAIVLFAQGMFTADLMMSNRRLWRYNLIWDKVLKTGFLNASRMPLRQHEDICVFYESLSVYHPQMTKCAPHKRNHSKGDMQKPHKNSCYGEFVEMPTIVSDEKFPISIITVPKEHKNGSFFHPTQKPVVLFEYLIKTYSNEGDTILDNCSGSGTTAIACMNTNREYICIERDEKYFEMGKSRIENHEPLFREAI